MDGSVLNSSETERARNFDELEPEKQTVVLVSFCRENASEGQEDERTTDVEEAKEGTGNEVAAGARSNAAPA